MFYFLLDGLCRVCCCFFFQAEDGIRDGRVTGVQTCALPILEKLLASGADPELLAVVELGLNHEQQHQELIVTDIKHVFSCNPLHPAYRAARGSERHPAAPLSWASFTEGTCEIGHAGGAFA